MKTLLVIVSKDQQQYDMDDLERQLLEADKPELSPEYRKRVEDLKRELRG